MMVLGLMAATFKAIPYAQFHSRLNILDVWHKDAQSLDHSISLWRTIPSSGPPRTGLSLPGGTQAQLWIPACPAEEEFWETLQFKAFVAGRSSSPDFKAMQSIEQAVLQRKEK